MRDGKKGEPGRGRKGEGGMGRKELRSQVQEILIPREGTQVRDTKKK